jgi:hypothetical protein
MGSTTANFHFYNGNPVTSHTTAPTGHFPVRSGKWFILSFCFWIQELNGSFSLQVGNPTLA